MKHVIRVYVADDHPIYRDGLVRAFQRQPGFEVVGESADGQEALAAIRQLRPDVAVLDLRMPSVDGTDVTRSIRRDELPTRVLLVSAFADNELIYRAIASGASAYLNKDADRDEICDTVAAIAHGETRLPPAIQAGLLAAIQSRDDDDTPTLSPREREILRMTADGLSAPGIAQALHLSPSTVKSHLQNLYEKLGVSDRAAAVAEGMRRGLVS